MSPFLALFWPFSGPFLALFWPDNRQSARAGLDIATAWEAKTSCLKKRPLLPCLPKYPRFGGCHLFWVTFSGSFLGHTADDAYLDDVIADAGAQNDYELNEAAADTTYADAEATEDATDALNGVADDLADARARAAWIRANQTCDEPDLATKPDVSVRPWMDTAQPTNQSLFSDAGFGTHFQALTTFQSIAATTPVDTSITSTWFDTSSSTSSTTSSSDSSSLSYTYDDLGRVSSVADSAGNAISFTYTSQGSVATRVVTVDDQSTQYAYDDADRLVGITGAKGGITSFTYDAAGNLATLTDPDGNTTTWLYDAQNRLVQETDPQGDIRTYVYDSAGDLVRYTDRNGRVRVFQYDDQHRLTVDTWYTNTTDADASQNPQNTIHYAYDSSGRVTSESDDSSSYAYTYGDQGRQTSATQTNANGPTVVFTYRYQGDSTKPCSLTVTVDGQLDYQNQYSYDSQGRLTRLVQSSQPDGNAVAEKEVDFVYGITGRLISLVRSENGQVVATSDYQYDPAGRLTGLIHRQGAKILAYYTWTYTDSGAAVLVDSVDSNTSGSSTLLAQELELPFHNTTEIDVASLGLAALADSHLTSATSSDGSVTYSYDSVGELTGADYSGTRADESYSYDANGNRTGSGYQVGINNELLSDGAYNYTYDAEGNRSTRTNIVTGAVTEYTWDARNRLIKVTDKATDGTITQVVENTYDLHDQWIGEKVTAYANGTSTVQTKHFVYENGQIVLEFEGDGTTSQLTHRYLWGSQVDQLVSDEQVSTPTAAGTVLWALTDNLGTVRDLAQIDAQSGVTTVVNHRVYSAYGELVSQTDASKSCLIGFTGRPVSEATGLQNNLERWYDAKTGEWASEDPIGFKGGDTNLERYVLNQATTATDPSGLSIAGKVLKEAVVKASEKGIKELVKKEIRDNWYKWVKMILKEQGLSELKQAHHIILQKLFETGRLADFFKEIGVLKDASKNIVVLATKKLAQSGAAVGDAALHAGRHIKDYRKLVEKPLEDIRLLYESGRLGEKGSAAAIDAAKEAVEKVQQDIRQKLLDGTIRLQRYDTPANRQKWLQEATTAIMALAVASGMTEAQAEEVATTNVERIVEQESYYRQKNIIVRYGQAGYYTKDSNSKVARWTAFAVDFFNPVDDVVVVTDLMEDAVEFARRVGIQSIEIVGDKTEKILLNYFDSCGSNRSSLWQAGKELGAYDPGQYFRSGKRLRDLLGN